MWYSRSLGSCQCVSASACSSSSRHSSGALRASDKKPKERSKQERGSLSAQQGTCVTSSLSLFYSPVRASHARSACVCVCVYLYLLRLYYSTRISPVGSHSHLAAEKQPPLFSLLSLSALLVVAGPVDSSRRAAAPRRRTQIHIMHYICILFFLQSSHRIASAAE